MLSYDEILKEAFRLAPEDSGTYEVIVEDDDYSHIVKLHVDSPAQISSETYDSPAEYADDKSDIISAITQDERSNIVKVWK